MSQQLDRSVRAYVARGLGINMNLVRPGNAKGPRPKAAYATVLPISDLRTGAPQYSQMNDGVAVGNQRSTDDDPPGNLAPSELGLPTGFRTETAYRRTYSLQFYRDGALDLANAFERWASSEDGLIAADTAFASYGGRLRRIRVHDGGSYSDAPSVTIAGEGGSGATAKATLAPGTGLRPVQGIGLTAFGSDYVNPTVTIGSGDPDESAVAIGWGFHVEHPLTVRRLDTILGDAFEERAQIDLPILYTTLDTQDTGGIDTWECEIVDGGSGEAVTA